jgi:hypothetical protein
MKLNEDAKGNKIVDIELRSSAEQKSRATEFKTVKESAFLRKNIAKFVSYERKT